MQLPAGTIAYRWFDGTLGRYQTTVKSSGGSATYDTTMTAVGFTRDHAKLLFSSGADMRVYDLESGEFDAVSFGSTTKVMAIHPGRPEVLISRVPGTVLEIYDFTAETYTPTTILKSGAGVAEFNPAGDTLFLSRNVSPFLELYAAEDLAPQPQIYTDVTNYINAEPGLSIVFNRVEPQVAFSLTGDRWLGVLDTITGEYIWDIYNPDAQWAYWSSFNELGDLLCVASDAFTLAQHTQVRAAADGAIVRYFSSPSSTSFTHGVFTGDGDSMVIANHGTLAGSIVNGRTGAVVEALLGAAQSVVTLPPYAAPPITEVFWTRRLRTVEVI